MTTAFTRTRQEIAYNVLGKIQNVRSTEAASADMEIVYEAIDLRLKEMHALGIFWRKVDKVPFEFSLSASTLSASATADILFPIKLMVEDGSRDEPVSIIGAREYAAIYDKAQTGLPTKALWKGTAEFIFHPVPTSATVAKLVYEKIADDTANSTAPDVEVSMLRSLADIVKYDVAEHFGVDEVRMQRWMREATLAERRIRFLSAERKDFSPVAVEDFDSRPEHRETDYGQ